MGISFADVASKPVGDIEKPPLAPVGTYRWQITKLPAQTESKDKKWDIVTFNCRAMDHLDDVDMTDYEGDVKNITNQVKFMFNKEDEAEFDKSLYRLRTFLEKHVRCCDEKDTVAQGLNNSVNQQFLGTIAWSQDDKDPEIFYANISRTAPLD